MGASRVLPRLEPFVSSVVAVPSVFREWHRLACAASGTSGCGAGQSWLSGERP